MYNQNLEVRFLACGCLLVSMKKLCFLKQYLKVSFEKSDIIIIRQPFKRNCHQRSNTPLLDSMVENLSVKC